MHYNEIKELAGRYRKNPTEAERRLWMHLRGRQLLGRKFLRQHPIVYQVNWKECFFFIPDFYCDKEKLVIELDGGVHDDRIEKDEHRDRILVSLGLTIIRIRNEELYDLGQVLVRISEGFK